MKIEKICINGTIMDPAKAMVPAMNQGLVSGLGVFETFRVSDGKVFLLDEHFARLQKSLKVMKLNSLDEIKTRHDISEIASKARKGHDAFIRLTVTANGGELAKFGYSSETTTIIYMSSIPKYEPHSTNAKILEGITRHQPEHFKHTGFRIKSLDYLHAHLAQGELDGGVTGIMLTPQGYVAEGLTANIFWVKNGRIFTSPLSLGILPGITRAYLTNSNVVIEEKAGPEELINADEIFLTGSVGYIRPLDKINDHKKPGITGPVCKKLIDNLSEDLNKLSQKLVN